MRSFFSDLLKKKKKKRKEQKQNKTMTKNNDIFIAKIGTIYDPVYITFTQNTTNIAPEEYALAPKTCNFTSN